MQTGDRITDGPGRGFTEYFRLSRFGQLEETISARAEGRVYAFRNPDPWADEAAGGWAADGYVPSHPYALVPGWGDAPRQDGRFQQPYVERPWWEAERPRRRPRRVDPDYFWGRGSIY